MADGTENIFKKAPIRTANNDILTKVIKHMAFTSHLTFRIGIRRTAVEDVTENAGCLVQSHSHRQVIEIHAAEERSQVEEFKTAVVVNFAQRVTITRDDA